MCPNMWPTSADLISSSLCSTENPVVKDPSWSCSRSCSPEASAGLAQRTTSESRPKNPIFSVHVIPYQQKSTYVHIFPTAFVQFPPQNLSTQKLFIVKHRTSLWKCPEGRWQWVCLQDLDDPPAHSDSQTELLWGACCWEVRSAGISFHGGALTWDTGHQEVKKWRDYS